MPGAFVLIVTACLLAPDQGCITIEARPMPSPVVCLAMAHERVDFWDKIFRARVVGEALDLNAECVPLGAIGPAVPEERT